MQEVYHEQHRDIVTLQVNISLFTSTISHHVAVSHHNNLRISRILKCMSEMGLEHLNAGLLLHVLYEQSTENQLKDRYGYLQSSMDRWWANCIRNQEEREFIGLLIGRVRRGEVKLEREKYEELLERRKRIGILAWDEPTPAEGGEAQN